jgi:branched-chain amino acid transport system substrate-binding protein
VPRSVKIGLSAPFEGLYRDLGYEALYAVRLAVRERNESGGIGGRAVVEMVALNDFNEPAEAAGQAAEMAADPDVLAVVGGFSVGVASAEAPEYRRLGMAAALPEMDPARLGAEAAHLALDWAGARRAAVLRGTADWDGALANAFSDAFVSGGGSILAQGTPAGSEGVAGLLPNAGRPADLLFVAADTGGSAAWIADARAAGFAGTILGGPDVGSALVVDLAGQASEGVVFVSPYAPVPPDPQFREAYQALSGGVAPGPVAAWTYRAANRLLDAMDLAARSGKPARDAVEAALRAQDPIGSELYAYAITEGEVYTPLNW